MVEGFLRRAIAHFEGLSDRHAQRPQHPPLFQAPSWGHALCPTAYVRMRMYVTGFGPLCRLCMLLLLTQRLRVLQLLGALESLVVCREGAHGTDTISTKMSLPLPLPLPSECMVRGHILAVIPLRWSKGRFVIEILVPTTG